MIMKRVFVIAVVALFTFAGSSALADDRFENGVTEYIMDTEGVNGEIVGPDGTVVTGGHRTKDHSLIKVRTNYIPELLKSVEDI
jgi:hypothetical protein